MHKSQRNCFFLPRRFTLRLGPGFLRITLLRLAGALLRVAFLLLFGPDFFAFERFRFVLRLRDGLLLERRLRAVFRDRDLRILFRGVDLRTVFRDRDLRLVLRAGFTLCIAAQKKAAIFDSRRATCASDAIFFLDDDLFIFFRPGERADNERFLERFIFLTWIQQNVQTMLVFNFAFILSNNG